MTRQSELKKRFDPEIGRYVKKNVHTGEIHGEGLTDILKSVGSKLFGQTSKEIAKKPPWWQPQKLRLKQVNTLEIKLVIK